jgi:hypothetical protein
VRLADKIASHYGPGGAALVVTSAWSGARWDELTGLQRPDVHLFDDDTGHIRVDPVIRCAAQVLRQSPVVGPAQDR